MRMLANPLSLQKYRNFLLCCILFLGQINFSQGQARFSAKAIAGFTASQIDGDASAGYHKVGLQGGLGVGARLKGKQSASMEFLFTQRGCRNQPQYFPYFSTTLNYVEVPFQWHYSDWLVAGEGSKSDWYRAAFNAGVSYSRLLGYKDRYKDGFGISSALEDLNIHSVCLVLGATIYMNRHLGWTFRYNRALNLLYKPGKQGTNYANSLYEHFLAIQLNYRI
jgi:Outer membrane protein beta-barrel domain